MCVRAASVCECARVCERGIGGKSVPMCVCVRERECVCECVCVSLCVCVCVCERERQSVCV